MELKKEFLPGKRYGEFTVQEFKMEMKIGYDKAKGLLDKAVQSGRLRKRTVGNRNYFSFVKGTGQTESDEE